jgi:hypothetical protein
MNRILIVLFAFLATGCGKNACEELADCLNMDAPTEEPTAEQEEACEEELEEGKEAGVC